MNAKPTWARFLANINVALDAAISDSLLAVEEGLDVHSKVTNRILVGIVDRATEALRREDLWAMLLEHPDLITWDAENRSMNHWHWDAETDACVSGRRAYWSGPQSNIRSWYEPRLIDEIVMFARAEGQARGMEHIDRRRTNGLDVRDEVRSELRNDLQGNEGT